MEKLKQTYKSVYRELMAADDYANQSKEYKLKGDTSKASMLLDIAQKEMMVADGVIKYFQSLQSEHEDTKDNPLYDFIVNQMIETLMGIKEKIQK